MRQDSSDKKTYDRNIEKSVHYDAINIVIVLLIILYIQIYNIIKYISFYLGLS